MQCRYWQPVTEATPQKLSVTSCAGMAAMFVVSVVVVRLGGYHVPGYAACVALPLLLSVSGWLIGPSMLRSAAANSRSCVSVSPVFRSF